MKQLIFPVFFFLFILSAQSQQVASYRQKISASKVPALVSLTFQQQYKDVLLIGWYATHITYWYEDTYVGWYNGWYQPRKVIIYTFEEPPYYEVEFVDAPGEPSRAIYNRFGGWFETRTKINGLPRKIIEEINKSDYRDWKRSEHMEKIEIPGMHGLIYRLSVSKGLKSHILRIDDQGHIIQIKRENK